MGRFKYIRRREANQHRASCSLRTNGYRDEVSSSLDANLSFDELLSTFHDLFDKCKLVSKKYKLLKKEHAYLVSDFDKLKIEHDDNLAPCTKCNQLEILRNENLLLKETLEKFEVGSKSLNMIFANKGHVHKRSGIRFVSSAHQNLTTFVKGPTLHVSPQNKNSIQISI